MSGLPIYAGWFLGVEETDRDEDVAKYSLYAEAPEGKRHYFNWMDASGNCTGSYRTHAARSMTSDDLAMLITLDFAPPPRGHYWTAELLREAMAARQAAAA